MLTPSLQKWFLTLLLAISRETRPRHQRMGYCCAVWEVVVKILTDFAAWMAGVTRLRRGKDVIET